MKTTNTLLFLLLQLALCPAGFFLIGLESAGPNGAAAILMYFGVFPVFMLAIGVIISIVSFIMKSPHCWNFSHIIGTIIMWPLAYLIWINGNKWMEERSNRADEIERTKQRIALEKIRLEPIFESIAEYEYVAQELTSNIVSTQGDSFFIWITGRDSVLSFGQYTDLSATDTQEVAGLGLKMASPMLTQKALDSIMVAFEKQQTCYYEHAHGCHELMVPCVPNHPPNDLIRIWFCETDSINTIRVEIPDRVRRR